LNQEKASAVSEIQTITDSDSSQEQPIANKSSECSLQEPTLCCTRLLIDCHFRYFC
jgi:hypothetical protein